MQCGMASVAAGNCGETEREERLEGAGGHCSAAADCDGNVPGVISVEPGPADFFPLLAD